MLLNFRKLSMKALLPTAMAIGAVGYAAADLANHIKNPLSETLAKQALNECKERVDTYSKLKESGVDIKPYLSNYGKAQVALDSVNATKFCTSRGFTPTDYEDAKFLKDSIKARIYGVEPCERTDSPNKKLLTNILVEYTQAAKIGEELVDAINKDIKESKTLKEYINDNK